MSSGILSGGMDGRVCPEVFYWRRGDALGASFGAVGLAAFAVVLWRFLPGHSSWGALALALGAWAVVSGALWILRKLSKCVRSETQQSMEREKH
jgi:hypothetical protein